MNRLCTGLQRTQAIGAALAVLVLSGSAMAQVAAPARSQARQARQAQRLVPAKVDPAALKLAQFTTDSRIPAILVPFVQPGGFTPRGCVTCDDTELEADCGIPVDTVNGGCNSTPEVFSDIGVGDDVCGTGAFDSSIGFRDTDWYRFTLAERSVVTWTATTEFDVLIGFVAQPCPQGAFIAGTAVLGSACGEISTTKCLDAGTYVAFIAPQFIDLACGAQYTATLSSSGACPPPGAGDICTTAVEIAAGTHNFDNTASVDDGPNNCGAMGSDVWYKFTPSGSGQAQVTTCGLTGMDTVLNVYDGCGGASIVCLDDFCGLQTTIDFAVTGGQEYFLQLGGFASQTGTGQFTLTLPEVNGACCAGDSCSIMTPANCAAAGGTYLGDGSNCGTPPGFVAGTCTDGTWEDISGSGALGCTGDDCFSNAPVGFDFTFYGNTYNTISISSNGYLQFGGGSSVFTNQAIPTAGFPDNLICPLWDDWMTGTATGGTIHTQTLGSAGSRRFIAQWTNVDHFPNTGLTATFQAVLFEGTNSIEFHYNNWYTGGGVSIGVENSNGTIGTSVDPNSVAQNGCVTLTLSGGESPCDDCPADYDGDGFLTGLDFDLFVQDFEAGDPASDYDGDGFITGIDFDFFVQDFEAGCE